ncbi:16S rRNA (cytosine(967)-C(5))-methyltransferase RsmB, partial [Candidatus Latescibacterota bacterium]
MKIVGKDKVKSTREIAVNLLTRIECDGAFADRLLSAKQVAVQEQRDRSFIRELVLGVLRWKLQLDYIIGAYCDKNIETLDPEILNILRIGLYQLLYMNSVPDFAAVNESVNMTRKFYGQNPAGLVNAVLRRFTREGIPEIKGGDEAFRLSVDKSCPIWIVRKWIDTFGVETAEAIIVSSNEKNQVSIRTNALKTDPETLSGVLTDEGYELTAIDKMPGYFNVSKGMGIFDTDSYKSGHFTAQDPVAGMATMLLAPQNGEKILDVCCAPGGKTTHIAELAGDDLNIDAVDINPKRLGLVRNTARRLGHKSIYFIEGDATKFGKEAGAVYDRILCDVPCSGSGVLSKRPDMKWKRDEGDPVRMSSLQKAILGNSAGLVKPGGVLVYSTCSLEPEENGDIIDWFLREYDFTIEKDDRFKEFETDSGYLILPQNMHGNGAFA